MAAPAFIAAGGAILGGVGGALLSNSPQGRSPSDLPGTGFDPDSDSVQSQLEILSLISLGASAEQIIPQGAPSKLLLNAIGTGAAGDIRQEGQGIVAQVVGRIDALVNEGLRQGLSPDQIIANVNADPVVRFHGPGFIIQQPLAVTGFGTIDDLVRAEVSFTQNRNVQVERLNALIPEIQAGQEAALTGASQILQNFIVPTQENIDQLSQSFSEDIKRQRLITANVGGFPADLRNIGREGQQQAIDLLTGEQNLQTNALNVFQAGFFNPIQSALNVSQVGQAAQLTGAQLTSAQAIALSNQTDQPNNNPANIAGLIGGLSLQQLLETFGGGGGGNNSPAFSGDPITGSFPGNFGQGVEGIA